MIMSTCQKLVYLFIYLLVGHLPTHFKSRGLLSQLVTPSDTNTLVLTLWTCFRGGGSRLEFNLQNIMRFFSSFSQSVCVFEGVVI